MNYHQLRAEAVIALTAWRAVHDTRDERVLAAHAVGLSKNMIHEITGVSRTTIDRILTNHDGWALYVQFETQPHDIETCGHPECIVQSTHDASSLPRH